tara:strand:- start:1742 stop:1912 length:171 start_codon:yes stop_codon:yes gene_type:complete
MKSFSPFEYKNQPSTLFSKKEKQAMHYNIVVKDVKPKPFAFYQKATAKTFTKDIHE